MLSANRLLLAAMALASMCGAASPARTTVSPLVAVLPLAADDTGLPYGLLPSRAELHTMTLQLRAGMESGGARLVAGRKLDRVLAASGFDQSVPMRSCVVADCAARTARALHSDLVVVGSVTREMAVVWSSSLQLVDARSGRVVTSLRAGYKGDVQAMERGERDAGACLARVALHRKPCTPDRGW